MGAPAYGQQRPVHWLNAGAMPPGAIGSLRLHRGGPLSGYFQPVRIRVPEGARIALALENGIETPPPGDVYAGLLIGPVYRLHVTDIPNHQGLELFPTIELVDRLYPPPCLALRFPIQIDLTQEELELAAIGGFITRIVYIEEPYQALPLAQRKDDELPWVEAPPGEDPLVTADTNGRAVAIVRIGGRVPTGASAALATGLRPPGVIFDAGQVAEALERHCDDKCVCQTGCNELDPYGPVVGPGDEYLCDGGDYGSPAGVRADWTVEGLEEEDAVSHYDTVDGRVVVTPSNRVCIYAPRFAVVRRVVQPIAHEQPVFINEMREDASPARAVKNLPPVAARQRHALAANMAKRPPSLFRQRQQAGELVRLQATMDAYLAIAPQVNLEVLRTGQVIGTEKALLERAVESAITLTGVQAPQVVFGVKQAHAMVSEKQVGVIYQSDEPNRPRLRLLKCASCGNALPGEEVEFTLRFDNIGDQVIGNVTIVDNLSRRLEYVPDSAKSSVDADFITRANDAGSLVLRWEIKDPVKPGEGGVLRFRVKVR
jgi:uncharacterized repeat protein (TIGR01451 family)